LSFVRSITMDKWKDLELQKMKVGGNQNAKQFMASQSDWNWKMPLNERYNTKAAALYRDKISAEAQGKSWSIETSSARDYVSRVIPTRSSLGNGSNGSAARNSTAPQSQGDWSSNSYQSYDESNVSRQKDSYFDRITSENANRPE
jgi:ADP-ribosylation factor GTPase-activating protein 1